MHNPTSVQENDTHKFLLDFGIQNASTNLVQKTKPHNNQQKKKDLQIVEFAVSADHRINLKESEKKDKYLDLARELKKNVEHESDNYTNCDWCFWYSHQRILKGTGGS